MISRRIVSLIALWLCAGAVNAADPQSSAAPFLSNCAFCHGVAGRGGRGPSLVSTRVVLGASDETIRSIVKNGIPGTGMPAFDLEKDELDSVVLYLRHLGGAGPKAVVVSGDRAHGLAVYSANGCVNCHRIGSAGSVYGPELTRIGSARSYEYLRDSVVNPSADIAQDYDGVTVVTPNGKRLTGVRINEDTFSVQLRLPDQRFALFDKADLQSVSDLDISLMPAYKSLPAADLNDLIAFLASLRGDSSGPDAVKAPGIH